MANLALFHLNSRKPQDLSVFNSARLNREQKIDLLDQLILESQRKNGIQPENPTDPEDPTDSLDPTDPEDPTDQTGEKEE